MSLDNIIPAVISGVISIATSYGMIRSERKKTKEKDLKGIYNGFLHALLDIEDYGLEMANRLQDLPTKHIEIDKLYNKARISIERHLEVNNEYLTEEVGHAIEDLLNELDDIDFNLHENGVEYDREQPPYKLIDIYKKYSKEARKAIRVLEKDKDSILSI